jgi:hypothetical protein
MAFTVDGAVKNLGGIVSMRWHTQQVGFLFLETVDRPALDLLAS